MGDQQVLRITARQIDELARATMPTRDLVLLLADLHRWHGGPILLRLDFPGEPNGGVELRAFRGTWLGWLIGKLAGRALEVWKNET